MKSEIQEEEVYTVKIRRDLATGVVASERWSMQGRGTHREGGPAIILRDRQTGVVKSETWARNNAFDTR